MLEHSYAAREPQAQVRPQASGLFFGKIPDLTVIAGSELAKEQRSTVVVPELLDQVGDSVGEIAGL